MKNQKRVTRREALKKMGISALALTGGAQAVALLTQSCSNTNGETFPYSNIVIKLTGMRITERREWHDCVKLSCDKGKTLGTKEKCEYLLRVIG